MSIRMFPAARAALASGGIDLDTDTHKSMLVDLSTTDTAIKAITGATNASPIVVTSTAHGFQNGDIVVQRGIGGNLAANGTFRVANQTANTYELQTLSGVNTTGSGAYTSGGEVIDLSLADFLDDVSAARIGTDAALSGVTVTTTNGVTVVDATDPVHSAVPNGTVSDAAIFYKDTGAEGTSRPWLYNDGRILVEVAADAASSATTLWVRPLLAALASGTQIVFTNGVTATLSGSASAGARSLAVNALPGAIAAGHHGDAAINVSPNFPISGNGGNITLQLDNGANKLMAFADQ